MDKSYIEEKVKELAPWYQTMNLDGVITRATNISGEYLWNNINKLVPQGFNDKRILDLGCNAGYYSFMASLNNCKEVIGVELYDGYFKQTKFIREYFEYKYNRKFDNVSFINKNISDLDFEALGKFDYIFALAILYHIGKHRFGKGTKETLEEQKRVISILTSKTDRIIVRSRVGEFNSMSYYNKIFKEVGFNNLGSIDNRERVLILYGR